MAQNRNRDRSRTNGSKRRAYDQNRDDLRHTPSQTPPNRRPASGGYGDPETVVFPTRPQNRSGQRNYEPREPNTAHPAGRRDNSVAFPTGNRPRPPQGRAANRNGQHPRNNTTRYPGNAAGNRPRNSREPQRSQPNGRLRPTQATMRDPARRERKKRRRMTRAAIRRRRVMRRLTAFALLLCVIGVGIYLTGTMLFKISAIQVQNADGAVVQELAGYSSDQILSALGVQIEENIFSVDSRKKAAELEKVFPKLESIQVEREYPGTVVVRAAEAIPSYAMQVQDGWLTLSAGLKILDKTGSQPAALPTLYGGEPVSETPGDPLTFEATEPAADSTASGAASDPAASSEAAAEPQTDHRLESLHTLMTALETYGLLDDVTRIEFEDTEQMAFLYQDRISVLLGTLNELDYKLKLGQYVLLDSDGKGCAATDTGVLDLSHLSASSTRKFRFAQGEPELPSGYVVPETPELPETPAESGAADPAAAETTPAADDAVQADPAAAADTAEDPTKPTETQTTNQE